ncbi:MAG TPA: DUF4384 domain-containing protein [Nitrospirota bacterium]|nr:DUF4384 domain-containing protein [Nitrospirota bacterium]
MMRAFIILAFLVVVPQQAAASEQPVWVKASGEASLGDVDTPKECKARATRDAQAKAVEQAVGTFITSHTLVSNFQVADDLVYASVRGRIEKMEVLDEGWDEKDRNRYRVNIKALVAPVYPEKGQNLSLKVALSKAVLKEGEETTIQYQANADCYIYIFSVAADGSVTLLLPNATQKDNRAKKDKAYVFPPAGSYIQLQAMFLPGFKERTAEEKIKIIAIKKEEAIVPLGFQEGMFTVYDAKSTGMISDLVKKLNQLDPIEWTEATATYKIVR